MNEKECFLKKHGQVVTMPCICIALKIESKVSMHNVLARKQSFQTECKMESVYMYNKITLRVTLSPVFISN